MPKKAKKQERLGRCPFCGIKALIAERVGPPHQRVWFVVCVMRECKARGPERKTCREALRAWNKASANHTLNKARQEWLGRPDTEILSFENKDTHKVTSWRAIRVLIWTPSGPWWQVYNARTKNAAIDKAMKAERKSKAK